MIMDWLFPIGVLIGAVGTRTAQKLRHVAKGSIKDWDWRLMLVVSWLPTFCWILAQFLNQE
jgi:hypothetical protein